MCNCTLPFVFWELILASILKAFKHDFSLAPDTHTHRHICTECTDQINFAARQCLPLVRHSSCAIPPLQGPFS